MQTYLDAIVEAHHALASADRRSQTQIEEAVQLRIEAGVCRGFGRRLKEDYEAGNLAVIAEIKRRSPSKGNLAVDLIAGRVAESYAEGGAAAISVLTDERFFGGSPDDLAEASSAVELPLLRKDFTVCERDVLDARIMGADAVLLIAAVLDDHQLADFAGVAAELGLDVLFEAHDEREVERSLNLGASIVGVNQRDLVTFEVDTERAIRVAGEIPAEVLAVAESGIAGPADAKLLADAGYKAVLVGESVVVDSDRAGAVERIRRSRGV